MLRLTVRRPRSSALSRPISRMSSSQTISMPFWRQYSSSLRGLSQPVVPIMATFRGEKPSLYSARDRAAVVEGLSADVRRRVEVGVDEDQGGIRMTLGHGPHGWDGHGVVATQRDGQRAGGEDVADVLLGAPERLLRVGERGGDVAPQSTGFRASTRSISRVAL